MSDNHFTRVGTNINDVKEKNAQSGLSYNEAKELIAKTTGGRDTAKYSNTNIEEVQNEINNQHNF
ncbi:hypothetical protein HNQ94_002259 [Salirhabdus euzebyi]|uniref:Gamma-type small acid-soluble spore protein n=1 Tax=Salirhabdus euzebyi TaxID=394506 RepID=A0A841Q5X8_9BACI|nr:gamma-type small acid-soluble spore protein [Salirhabdus euzebyi]MBB6453808.1 hypothetical protein [Salirhabdus euzebyi]